MRPAILVLSLAALSSCTAPQEHTESTPLSALVERPDDYSGQEVEVSGFMLVSWEGGGIFRTESDEQSYSSNDAIRLRVPSEKLGPLEQYDGTFGVVSGVFESDQSHGWRGTISVSKMYPVFRFRAAYRPTKRPASGDPEDLLREQVYRTLRESDLERKSQ